VVPQQSRHSKPNPKLLPQLKEKLLRMGIQTPMDLERLCNIIKASDYHGTIPIETLGMKDPLNEVPVFFNRVKDVLFS